MRIKASAGNASKTATLSDGVYSLTLTAQTAEERVWLAGLFKAVRLVAPSITFRATVPELVITEASDTERNQPDDRPTIHRRGNCRA